MKAERVFRKLREPCSIIGPGVVENSRESIALARSSLLEQGREERGVSFRFFNRCRGVRSFPRKSFRQRLVGSGFDFSTASPVPAN